MTILEETGGARVGLKNASWPFARLTVSRKELRLNVQLIGRYIFRPQDIVEVEVITKFPIIGKGIRIHHSITDYPPKIIFWTLNDPDAVMERIVRTGFIKVD